MTGLWTPRNAPGASIVDTPVDAMLRHRHIERLTTLAEKYEDEAYEVASLHGFKRAKYPEMWAGRTRATIAQVAAEPFRKALAPLDAPRG